MTIGTIWLIGWLYTVGRMTVRSKTSLGSLVAALLAMFIWPIMLGEIHEVG